MNYDNYNFEEAYKEQVNKLEEYELERLLRESKVKCLYRTTTTKSRNIKTGKTLLEAQIYPSFKCYKDVPKVKTKKSKEAQRNLNDKNRSISLMGIIGRPMGGTRSTCRKRTKKCTKTSRIISRESSTGYGRGIFQNLNICAS